MVKKMTDEQQEFLNAEGKVVIKACPGSGKTYTVAHKLLSYVDNWKDYHSASCKLKSGLSRMVLISLRENCSSRNNKIFCRR